MRSEIAEYGRRHAVGDREDERDAVGARDIVQLEEFPLRQKPGNDDGSVRTMGAQNVLG